ncbi:ABC transporter ATP-binding protein [Reyranella soli]|uniref:Spermidine/putrescine import ATP-binding protein PotA n=1 Tax=Reyranella soli TaxID=1230389 RepID=A0A512NR11_9HYPH|nr:ABC transporter ATP-binding protein [Reyranella soli]GEP61390.1 polyamine-transporting ATPase [Reyranella soli]
MSAKPLVRFTDVSKSYDGKTDAVRTLNLDVQTGEFLTLLGPSGSGKTTTLTMLAGFEQPTSGRIFVSDEDVTTVPVDKRGIGMVFQNYALFPNMTVGENIGFPLRVRGLARAAIGEKVARALAMVRLEGLADRRPQQLSGGQQQRVAVARALVFEPRLVLLDEPLGALDRQLREQMQYELKQLHRRLDVTMVYVTHDQVEAMTMSDRVAVFSTGLLRQVAEPRRLYEEPESLFVAQFLGESNALAATIAQRDGAQCKAVLPTGETIVAAAVGTCAAGGEADLVLRPEKVALGAAALGCTNRFPARVVEATFLGDQLRVRLMTLGREDFVIKLPNAAGQGAIEPGSAVEIGWRAEDCRALAR